MHKLYVGILFITLVVVGCLTRVADAVAIGQSIIISQVQVGNGASASNELIEIYNNSDTPVDITGWCLYYASASSQTFGSKLVCFTTNETNVHIFLPARSYAFAVSSQFNASNPGLGGDLIFSATLSGTAGHIRLVNAQNNEIDKLGWGQTAASAEGNMPSNTPGSSAVLERKMTNNATYQDTDNNGADFQLVSPRKMYSFGSLYDVRDVCLNINGIQESMPVDYGVDAAGNCSPPPVDVCSNIDGLQIVLPVNYLFNEDGNCKQDVCINITGLQAAVPIDMDVDVNGNCYVHDECVNLPGVQSLVPGNFMYASGGGCTFSLLVPFITELLPNVSGDDSGNEFIEIYNPNDKAVDLTHFRLVVGQKLEKSYVFPDGASLAPMAYTTFYNSSLPFSLLNTSSRAGLVLADMSPISQTETYASPDDDETWTLVDGVWQYSNQPTPGEENQPSLIIVDTQSTTATTLQPCGPNQYRSPETNRCRNILLAAGTLAACKEGQYRSEETNRCRSFVTAAVLKVCEEDQFRNPATGRCKKIASTEELAASDCGEGRERNQVTNRCRNIVTSAMPNAAFAVEPVQETGKAFVGWWVLGGMSLLALGYAGWEWRSEISRSIRSITTRHTSGK